MKKRTKQEKNKLRKFYLPEVILIVLSLYIRYENKEINMISVIDNYNLIQLIFIILGLSITLATFLYAITDRFKKNDDLQVARLLQKVEQGVTLEIKRMITALFIIVVITFTASINLPFVHSSYYFNKYFIYDSIKIFVFFYVLLAFVDIVITVLNMFDMKDNDFS